MSIIMIFFKKLLPGIILLTSCSDRIADFTMVSTKNVPMTNGVELRPALNQRVDGTSSKISILFFSSIPSMKDAVDQAIQKYPGAVALADAAIYSKYWTCFLFGQSKYVVQGTPVYPILVDKNPQNVDSQASFDLKKDQVNLQESETITHVVQKGETLLTIAKKYGISIPNLLEWNNLSSTNIVAGAKIIVFLKNK